MRARHTRQQRLSGISVDEFEANKMLGLQCVGQVGDIRALQGPDFRQPGRHSGDGLGRALGSVAFDLPLSEGDCRHPGGGNSSERHQRCAMPEAR